ncbi:pirin family protein [Nitrosopumilus sp.]|uniref:pirin family protein n=1 Tax=Nitrosopumilus sp. TaxID=2024843 RepID=UPI0034A0A428
MQQIIQKNEHFNQDHGWLNTYYHFSFAEYHNPNKMNYGPLRVFNDDIVQPGKGFGFHPHENMEIVTYVIDGNLEHKDNHGNHGIISSGGVQRMSAGTGVVHSEFNSSDKNPLRLLQLWFLAKKKNLSPSWEERQYTQEDRQNKLLQVITGDVMDDNSAMKIHQDVKIYVSSLTENTTLSHKLEDDRKSYLFIISGDLDLDGNSLKTRDAVMIEDEKTISFTAKKDTELILLDLPTEFQFNQ